MKLTGPQLRALRAFERPWVAAWWGGRPMTKYPSGVGVSSFSALRSMKLIRMDASGRLDFIVSLTDDGRAALNQKGEE